MLLVLMVSSKGIAGVPARFARRGGGRVPLFNLPEAGAVLILGIDHFLDMGRTLTNVMGNAIAAPWWPSGRGPSTPCPDALAEA